MPIKKHRSSATLLSLLPSVRECGVEHRPKSFRFLAWLTHYPCIAPFFLDQERSVRPQGRPPKCAHRTPPSLCPRHNLFPDRHVRQLRNPSSLISSDSALLDHDSKAIKAVNNLKIFCIRRSRIFLILV
jgi:hypothetical protein